ncbi:hypothetical protein CASFOL_027960 [Castilleja foliolosa]|uniref:Uncharacterized protein n=1 Tax=Castilleja foliolosa TaxID=1961234 RepID=A0ABD3CI23_9LAMI
MVRVAATVYGLGWRSGLWWFPAAFGRGRRKPETVIFQAFRGSGSSRRHGRAGLDKGYGFGLYFGLKMK